MLKVLGIGKRQTETGLICLVYKYNQIITVFLFQWNHVLDYGQGIIQYLLL